MELCGFNFKAGSGCTGLGIAPPPSLELFNDEVSDPPPQVSTNFLYLVATTWAYAAGAAAITKQPHGLGVQNL